MQKETKRFLKNRPRVSAYHVVQALYVVARALYVVARELRRGTQSTRIALLDRILRNVTKHSTQHGYGSRSCGGKVVFESGSSIRIGCGSTVPCWESNTKNHDIKKTKREKHLTELVLISNFSCKNKIVLQELNTLWLCSFSCNIYMFVMNMFSSHCIHSAHKA